MRIFVGDDWAEDHHDVHLMNDDGARLAARRLPEGLEGIRTFHELVAVHAGDPGEVIVGIETDRGLWVTTLVAAGYQVYGDQPVGSVEISRPSQCWWREVRQGRREDARRFGPHRPSQPSPRRR